MNLARPFKAGVGGSSLFLRRVSDDWFNVQSSLTRRWASWFILVPALKRRAKLKPTLRVDRKVRR